MHSCSYSDSRRPADPLGTDSNRQSVHPVPAGFTIGQLAREFGVTLRALRFYEIRGLLAPVREGRQRVFSRADRDRLALILKGKKLGFTLVEISQMLEAQAGQAQPALKLSPEQCREQIAIFEQQIREVSEALTELRRVHAMLHADER